MSLYDNLSTPANSTVRIDPGSTVVLEGVQNATVAALSGSGTLRNNDNWGSSVLNVGTTNAATVSTFTGPILGQVRLNKLGADTQELGPVDDITLILTVSSGRLRPVANLRVGFLQFNKAQPGQQSLDLAGHALRIISGGMPLIALESQLNQQVGDASDGLYDSTATPKQDVGMARTTDGFLVKKTLAGDANVDGAVNFTDLVIIAQNYNTDEVTWAGGDFTHDGFVNFADLVKLAQNYNQSLAGAPIPGSTADFSDDLAAAFASVPEPGALALLPCAIAPLLRRRRRRSGVSGLGHRPALRAAVGRGPQVVAAGAAASAFRTSPGGGPRRPPGQQQERGHDPAWDDDDPD